MNVKETYPKNKVQLECVRCQATKTIVVSFKERSFDKLQAHVNEIVAIINQFKTLHNSHEALQMLTKAALLKMTPSELSELSWDEVRTALAS